jgi:NAD-dependent SIR2 family protein deacetylase
MGVDSRPPDFRGTEGCWRAYPALRPYGMSFEDIANPAGFESNPRLSWGVYSHRLALYRATVAHAGVDILLRWASEMKYGAFVFTSNVDGQFQKAGFDAGRIAECHGSIHRLQCLEACTDDSWPAGHFSPSLTTLIAGSRTRCPSARIPDLFRRRCGTRGRGTKSAAMCRQRIGPPTFKSRLLKESVAEPLTEVEMAAVILLRRWFRP